MRRSEALARRARRSAADRRPWCPLALPQGFSGARDGLLPPSSSSLPPRFLPRRLRLWHQRGRWCRDPPRLGSIRSNDRCAPGSRPADKQGEDRAPARASGAPSRSSRCGRFELAPIRDRRLHPRFFIVDRTWLRFGSMASARGRWRKRSSRPWRHEQDRQAPAGTSIPGGPNATAGKRTSASPTTPLRSSAYTDAARQAAREARADHRAENPARQPQCFPVECRYRGMRQPHTATGKSA